MNTPESPPLRVVIVDDERPARNELQAILQPWTDVRVVAEAATVDEAKEALAVERPDLVLLDIHLRKRSGFEVLEGVDDNLNVVFVTAHADHAVRAFEFSAVDYLLKPVETVRLREAVDRCIKRRSPSPPRSTGDASAETPLLPHAVLVLKSGRRYHFVAVEKVRHIEAQGEYSEVHADAAVGLSARSLSEWENVLPTDRFVRIHRSTIVNLQYVSMMVPAEGGGFELLLNDRTQPLAVSRRYAAKIRARLM